MMLSPKNVPSAAWSDFSFCLSAMNARTKFVHGTFGDQISQGMVAEIIAAKEQGIPVRYVSQKDIDTMTNENGGNFNEN